MPRLFICVWLALLLSACGGGDGVGDSAAHAAPAAAAAVFVTGADDEAIVAAGRDVQLTITSLPGAAGTLRIRQVSGIPLGELTLNGSLLSFHAPELRTAGAAELELSSSDGPGKSSTLKVLVSPSSTSGRLLTLMGSPDSAGLHWIITGDGFTVDQQHELRRTALQMGRALTGTPELSQHAAIWNVHVLGAASPDSGVDGPGRAADTAFDGALGCTGVARVACVDWRKVQNAVLAEDSPRAYLAVVLNSSEYVGTSGPNGLIISRHAAAPALAVHEMGHQVAGLADEYADAVTAQDLLPLYVEGRYPNVTNSADPARAPWRHWLDTAGAEVGMYEGAYYADTGFYRAKADSLMRTLAAPLGQVNGEAWLRAQYLRVPPVAHSTPNAGQVQGLAGDNLNFALVSSWPREVVGVRWFLDDTEVIAARDAPVYRLVADGAVHRVRVEAADVTGRIRAPAAAESRYARTWSVSPLAGAVEKASRESPLITEWLQMQVDDSGHAVLGRVHNRFMRPQSGHGDWQYTVLDKAGQVIAQGDFQDPRLVRGPMALPGESGPSHPSAVLPAGHYLIGLPGHAGAHKVRITPVGAREKQDRGFQSGATELLLDAP